MVNYREEIKKSANSAVSYIGRLTNSIARYLAPFLGDMLLSTLYEAEDWANEIVGVAGEAADQYVITVANGLYDLVGRVYRLRGWMTEEELAEREHYVKVGGSIERGEVGPLDVIPAYHGSLGMYHVLRTIRGIRDELYDVLEPVYKKRKAYSMT